MSSGVGVESYSKNNLIYVILFLQRHMGKPYSDNLHKFSKAELVAKARRLNSFTWRGETQNIFGWGYFGCYTGREWQEQISDTIKGGIPSYFEKTHKEALLKYINLYGKTLHSPISCQEK